MKNFFNRLKKLLYSIIVELYFLCNDFMRTKTMQRQFKKLEQWKKRRGIK